VFDMADKVGTAKEKVALAGAPQFFENVQSSRQGKPRAAREIVIHIGSAVEGAPDGAHGPQSKTASDKIKQDSCASPRGQKRSKDALLGIGVCSKKSFCKYKAAGCIGRGSKTAHAAVGFVDRPGDYPARFNIILAGVHTH